MYYLREIISSYMTNLQIRYRLTKNKMYSLAINMIEMMTHLLEKYLASISFFYGIIYLVIYILLALDYCGSKIWLRGFLQFKRKLVHVRVAIYKRNIVTIFLSILQIKFTFQVGSYMFIWCDADTTTQRKLLLNLHR